MTVPVVMPVSVLAPPPPPPAPVSFPLGWLLDHAAAPIQYRATIDVAKMGGDVPAAFHHLPAKELGHLGDPIDSDVLICSDDPEATRIAMDIVSHIPGCRPLDAGELSNATAIEAFTAVLLQLNVRYKTRVAPKLTGIKKDPRA